MVFLEEHFSVLSPPHKSRRLSRSAGVKPLAEALIHDASVLARAGKSEVPFFFFFFNFVKQRWEIGHNEIWGNLKSECVL